MFLELRKNLGNTCSTRRPINCRNFLLEIALHILNSEATQKYLLCLCVFILQVAFVDQVSTEAQYCHQFGVKYF